MKKIIINLLVIFFFVLIVYFVFQSIYKNIATAEEVAEAEKRCLQRTGELPTRPFTSDGCTLSPNWNVFHCCVEHDMDYWCGGTKEERKNSDFIFRQCVQEQSDTASLFYWIGVRVGGISYLPTPWRWGYGHKFLHDKFK
jgi:hypothetical protein